MIHTRRSKGKRRTLQTGSHWNGTECNYCGGLECGFGSILEHVFTAIQRTKFGVFQERDIIDFWHCTVLEYPDKDRGGLGRTGAVPDQTRPDQSRADGILALVDSNAKAQGQARMHILESIHVLSLSRTI
jgi:hypothetical protein